MKHIFYRNDRAAGTFIALHGTGGDEHSLVKIAHQLSPSMNYLGIRGNVDENGMARYFRRIREGVFDMEDLRIRTAELADFLRETAEEYDISLSAAWLLGYSNGANIAANLLLSEQDIAAGAILLHPMVPSREETAVTLEGKPVFISAGRQDPLVPIEETEELAQLLAGKGADVRMRLEDQGHEITAGEIADAKEWLAGVWKQSESE